jgi:hypothetical protein
VGPRQGVAGPKVCSGAGSADSWAVVVRSGSALSKARNPEDLAGSRMAAANLEPARCSPAAVGKGPSAPAGSLAAPAGSQRGQRGTRVPVVADSRVADNPAGHSPNRARIR